MKKRKLTKEACRKGLISFCITCLLLVFLAGSSVALYNTASVLYGEGEVATVQKSGTSYEFTLFSEKRAVSAEKAENAAEWVLGYSPWLPREMRVFLLAAGGIWQSAQEAADFWLGR